MSAFNPSPQQAEALEKLKEFLDRPGPGVFILKGYAGTGKTTLLQQLALQLKKEKKSFVLLAPTGRAATVLRARTGLDAKTIHGELYHFSKIDGEPNFELTAPHVSEFGQMRLLFALRPQNDSEKKTYVIDEASMVSDDTTDVGSFTQFGTGKLLSDLQQIAGSNKMILSGDPCQLPPVGDSESKGLDAAWMQQQGKTVEIFELTDILRQKADSDILQLATKVRYLATLPSYPKWVKLPATDSAQVQLLGFEVQKGLYSRHIRDNGPANTIAICHSNYQCAAINTSIRKDLYGDADAALQVGDMLMVTQNNYMVPLTNGDFVTVTNIGIDQGYLGIRFLRVTVKAQLTSQEHEVLLCQEVLFNGQANLNTDQQRSLMIDFSTRMRADGIRPGSEAYKAALQKDPYLNSLRANFGYAVTCHKSQGGEWDQVFLFLSKGMYQMKPAALTRWWYTGITRARKKLYIVKDWWIQ